MSKEDDMAMKLAEMAESDLYDRINADYEKHYNHYGSRGVADLYVQQFEDDWRRDTVYEIKADPAIRAATGANEIIRQFNRMCKYFYAGIEEAYPPRGSTTPSAELTFVASELSFEHLKDNFSIYESIHGESVDAAVGSVETGVAIRSPGDETSPFFFFHDELGVKGDPLECRTNRKILKENGLDASVVEL